MRRLNLAVLLLAATPVHGAVSYYFTDTLASIDPARWSNSSGGHLISNVPIPDGSSEAEVSATITLNSSGGVYTEYLQASRNAHTDGDGGGSFLAFEMQNPTFDGQGNCMASFLLFQGAPGAVTLLASFQHGCRNGMQMRFAVHGSTALVYPDQAAPVEFAITPGAGQPGIGIQGAPAGNAISQVKLGSIIRTPPAAVTKDTIGVSAFRNRIDVQWKAVPEDTNGGLAGYWISRDGVYLMRTNLTHFSDETVSPGQSHSYTINAVDEHFNVSPGTSITVETPAVQAK